MSATPPSNGLFDDFPERRTPTPEQYADTIDNGMIALDANVLLNLYRYGTERRDELIGFLDLHREQLFVPHQALKEFWANRQTVLHSVEAEANATAQELGGLLGQATNKLAQWANRIGLAEDRRTELDEQLSAGFREAEIAVRQALPLMTKNLSHNTNDDQILLRLEPILDGRVGPPLPADDHRAALAEGVRRFDAGEPPGFGDKNKKGDARAGDYLVWEQTLREAEKRSVSVLFVTDDATKNDWYLVVSGQRRGPLPELVAELHARAGTRLLMTLTSGLAQGEETPAAPTTAADGSSGPNADGATGDGQPAVDDPSTEDDDGSGSDPEPAAPAAPPPAGTGWTRAALDELLSRLAVRAPVQHAALTSALRTDGFVSRDTVYKLGSYPETRTLRGFTRPVLGVCQQLRSEGQLPQEAPDALEAVYDPAHSYVQASGFRVPNAIVHLAE